MALNRRTVLGAAAAAGFLPAWGDEERLGALAASRGKLFGCAAGSYQLKDADFAAVLAREANILVPEYELKREIVEPQPGRFDFSGADALAAFTSRHEMKMRGHTLVWYAANPAWLNDKVLNAPNDEILTDFVARCVGRYQGHMHSWDVVNEAIFPDDGRPDGLRNCAWLTRFGPGYIDLAFNTAKRTDPDALLVYNDWGCEGGQVWSDRFRAATLKFLEKAKAGGVPIDGLGLQGHLNGFGPPIDQDKLRAFLDEVRAMGFAILITELDVDDTDAPRDLAARDRAVADATARFLDVVLDNPATCAVLTWGLTDRYLPSTRPGYRPRKLPLDLDLKHKPMWEAIARSFAELPQRLKG